MKCCVHYLSCKQVACHTQIHKYCGHAFACPPFWDKCQKGLVLSPGVQFTAGEALQLCCKGNDKIHKGGCSVSHPSEREKDIAKTWFLLI